MQESYGEGLANHAGPESCGTVGNGSPEALTGVCAGWVLSPEKDDQLAGADALLECGRQHRSHRNRKVAADPTGSETPGMHSSSSHGKREIPRLTSLQYRGEVRTKNPTGTRS